MKIKAFTKYSYEGPSSRYRFYNYRECFKKKNIELEILPLFEKEYFEAQGKINKLLIVVKSYLKRFFQLKKLKKKDVVVIEYELFPFFPAFFEKKLRRNGIKYIVDYDDAIFHRYDLNKNFLIKKILKDKIAQVIKNASKVIVCNKYLKDYVKKYNSNILLLHTVVLLDKYIEKSKNFKKRNNKFIVGWIGSKTTSKYILEIFPVFEKLKDLNIQFNLVGFDEDLLDDELKKKFNINVIPWREDTEIDNILEFDVGIMPLDDTPWSRGKCGFKLIQYMSCKKPVIASPVGINKDIVDENIGFLAENLEDWEKYIKKLYKDEKLRTTMGKKAFEKVLEKYNYKKNCEKYFNLINEVIECAE